MYYFYNCITVATNMVRGQKLHSKFKTKMSPVRPRRMDFITKGDSKTSILKDTAKTAKLVPPSASKMTPKKHTSRKRKVVTQVRATHLPQNL